MCWRRPSPGRREARAWSKARVSCAVHTAPGHPGCADLQGSATAEIHHSNFVTPPRKHLKPRRRTFNRGTRNRSLQVHHTSDATSARRLGTQPSHPKRSRLWPKAPEQAQGRIALAPDKLCHSTQPTNLHLHDRTTLGKLRDRNSSAIRA